MKTALNIILFFGLVSIALYTATASKPKVKVRGPNFTRNVSAPPMTDWPLNQPIGLSLSPEAAQQAWMAAIRASYYNKHNYAMLTTIRNYGRSYCIDVDQYTEVGDSGRVRRRVEYSLREGLGVGKRTDPVVYIENELGRWRLVGRDSAVLAERGRDGADDLANQAAFIGENDGVGAEGFPPPRYYGYECSVNGIECIAITQVFDADFVAYATRHAARLSVRMRGAVAERMVAKGTVSPEKAEVAADGVLDALTRRRVVAVTRRLIDKKKNVAILDQSLNSSGEEISLTMLRSYDAEPAFNSNTFELPARKNVVPEVHKQNKKT